MPFGVLEGMRGVGVEEAPAVGAELLDRHLGRRRAAGDGLLGALEGHRLGGGVQVLHHALGSEDEGEHHAERDQDSHGDAGEVHPEVAHGVGPTTGQPPDERRQHRQPRRGRHEVLRGQPNGLGEVRHRRLTAVVLPVGVGDERHRGVEGQSRRHVGEVIGVERQRALEAEEGEEAEDRHHREGEQRQGISGPALLALRIDPGEAIDGALDGQKDPVAGGGPIPEDPGQELPQHRGQPDHQGDEERDLQPARKIHLRISPA